MKLANPDNSAPIWMSRWLRAAGVYNVAWGLLTLLYPNWLFHLTGLTPPNYPFIWQCVGMIVGVYGVGYWIAAGNPFRHWPIVLVGLLGKLFGPAGYSMGVLAGALKLDNLPGVSPVPVEFGVTLLTNDLVWWVPFAGILLGALRANTLGTPAAKTDLPSALTDARTTSGASLLSLAQQSPVLALFLRHTGCTFCKEALADLKARRAAIEAAGVRPVVIAMSPPDRLQATLARYGLSDLAAVSDPDRRLYAAAELHRGSLAQLFGPIVWWRGLQATLKGHLVGRLEGDGFQMPGALLIHQGRVLRAYRHRTAADRPDLASLACDTPEHPEPAPLPA